METARQTQNETVEYVETKHYMFAPSIGKCRTVDGKTYIVRSILREGRISRDQWNGLPLGRFATKMRGETV